MRPVICKCPNHTGCLLAYHGDDIEVADGAALVCPECGAALKFAPKPRSDLFFRVVNFVVFAATAVAIWFAWPGIVRLWQKVTTAPPKAASPAR